MSKILRQAFLDVCNGYSLTKFNGKQLFIKHLSHKDHLFFDDVYDEALKGAIDGGILKEKDKLEYLKKEGLWSDKQDIEIDQKRYYIGQLEASKKNFRYPSQLESHIKVMKIEEDILKKLELKKVDLMGMTAEGYAAKIQTDHYMLMSFFTDNELTNPLYTPDEFDQVEDKEFDQLFKAYQKESEKCSDFNLKKLSFQDFFISYYYLCGDEVYQFFGKPITSLTFYQLKLISYARYFKNLLEGVNLNNLPQTILENPDELVNYLTATKNGQDMINKNTHANVSIVGGTKDDIKALTGEQKNALPNKNMNMQEMIKQQLGRS